MIRCPNCEARNPEAVEGLATYCLRCGTRIREATVRDAHKTIPMTPEQVEEVGRIAADMDRAQHEMFRREHRCRVIPKKEASA